MSLLFLHASFLFLCLGCFIEANLSNVARVILTGDDAAVKNASLPGHRAPVQVLLGEEPDTVTVVGQTHVNSFNFRNPVKTQVKEVLLSKCQEKDCIAMVHGTTKAEQLFLCGAAGGKTFGCYMNLADEQPTCASSEKTQPIESSITGFNIKEGEPSAFVESGDKADLYVTHSGSEDHVGIYKFGKHKVGPANHNKEQHYVSLINQGGDSVQDKVYAFYKEKNKDPRLDSEMWLPFVTRVCMADVGGPKNNLQFSWTSQMNAKLFCGDPDKKQHFSELIDVATVRAERWQDTRVYALFKNEWGMSAVCVYTMKDIDDVFATSPFKGYSGSEPKRPRECVEDSTKIPLETLGVIKKTPEMEDWVLPEKNSLPLFLNNYNYTHICVDRPQHQGNKHTVLFLTLNNGRIHKVIHQTNQPFLIAEYRPFKHQAHIISITLDPSSMKLYVTTRSELVQLDVANCASYGDSCEDCVLARDPYCGWNSARCSRVTRDSLQDVTGGNHSICQTLEKVYRHAAWAQGEDSILLPAESKFFLNCPVSSRHAQYSWHHRDKSTSCRSNEEQCLLLINNMNHEQEGIYRCVSEEKGLKKVLAEVQLQMENRAADRSSSLMLWVCLMAVLIRSL